MYWTTKLRHLECGQFTTSCATIQIKTNVLGVYLMSDKIEFDLKEYLEAKFAEQTRLHEAHAATTAAHVKSIENQLKGVEGKIEGKIDGVEGKLEGKIDGVEGKIEGKIDGVDKRVGDLRWFIGILVAITVVAVAGIAWVSFNHEHAQEVTSPTGAQSSN